MSIDREELERLLTDRPTAQRSAMQAVRDSFDDITLMRERGLSWADISDMLARLGVTTRDGTAIPPVTLRSAYFLVGNETRDDLDGEEKPGAPPVSAPAVPPPEPRPALTAPAPPAAESGEEELPTAPDSEEIVAEAVPPAPPAAPAEPNESVDPAVDTQDDDESAPAALPPDNRAVQPQSENASLEAITNVRDRPMLGTIFVLNDRGGVGKTLLSHHLMATAMLEGQSLKVVEYEVNERLARLFGTEMVEHRRISQDFMNLMGSGDGFYEFWDQIGPELQRGGRLFDFGGNISQWFFNWAEVSGFDYYVGDGERLTFMVPVTVDLASLSTGMATIDRISAIAPRARRVLVENGVSGPFGQLDDSQYGRRKAELVERHGVEVIAMPPCTAPAWARLTGHRIDDVARMTREDLVKLGMTPPVASRSLIIIHDWLRQMRQALSPYIHEALRSGTTAAAGGRGH